VKASCRQWAVLPEIHQKRCKMSVCYEALSNIGENLKTVVTTILASKTTAEHRFLSGNRARKTRIKDPSALREESKINEECTTGLTSQSGCFRELTACFLAKLTAFCATTPSGRIISTSLFLTRSFPSVTSICKSEIVDVFCNSQCIWLLLALCNPKPMMTQSTQLLRRSVKSSTEDPHTQDAFVPKGLKMMGIHHTKRHGTNESGTVYQNRSCTFSKDSLQATSQKRTIPPFSTLPTSNPLTTSKGSFRNCKPLTTFTSSIASRDHLHLHRLSPRAMSFRSFFNVLSQTCCSKSRAQPDHRTTHPQINFLHVFTQASAPSSSPNHFFTTHGQGQAVPTCTRPLDFC
jgi:hypothetical protein